MIKFFVNKNCIFVHLINYQVFYTIWNESILFIENNKYPIVIYYKVILNKTVIQVNFSLKFPKKYYKKLLKV